VEQEADGFFGVIEAKVRGWRLNMNEVSCFGRFIKIVYVFTSFLVKLNK
jgi:hypothetical protein